jgi:hypothetical protein
MIHHIDHKCQRALKFEDIDEGLSESIKKMFNSFIEYQRQGSNWTVDKVVDLTMHMAPRIQMRLSLFFCFSNIWISDILTGNEIPSKFIEFMWSLYFTIRSAFLFVMARYRPLKGSSYIPLPIRLRSKYTIINVTNKDNKCFMWSIMAALYPTN